MDVRDRLGEPSDWGALGCWIGRRITDYWQVPVITGHELEPTVDALNHLAAALASYGSFPMFHVVGVPPEEGKRNVKRIVALVSVPVT